MALRVGVVGLGAFGIIHLRCFRQLARRGEVELVAGCETNEQLLRERQAEFGFAPYTDHREMLAREELDAVTVATPDHLHREIVLDALRAGCHVLCEKPLDVSVAGCQEMVAAAAEAQRLLQVDFHKRYDPYHVELARLVAEGKLGEVLYGYAHMEDRIDVPTQTLRRWAKHSSPVWFLGVHMFDLARFVLRAEAVRVFAHGAKSKLPALGIDTWDAVQATVDFDNGAQFTFHLSWILPEAFEASVNQGIRVVGSEGLVEVDTQNRGAESCLAADGGMRTYNLGFLARREDARGEVYWEGYGIAAIADFAQNAAFLLGGGTLEELEGKYPSGKDGLEATRIAAAAERSAQTGELVALR